MSAALALGLSAPEQALVYRLCARLLLRELDAATVATLLAPGVAESLEAAASGTTASLAGWDAAATEAHAEEFTRLFLIPGGVSPRAAAWGAGERERLGAGVAREVRALLPALGRRVDAPAGVGRLPEDHVALLLELAACGLEGADPARGLAFVAAAVTPWAQPFGLALGERAALPIYRALGTLIAQLHAAPAAAEETP